MPANDDYWYEIKQNQKFGPFAWYITVGRGWTRWGPDCGGWHRATEKGALKKALSELKALKKRDALQADRKRVVIK